MPVDGPAGGREEYNCPVGGQTAWVCLCGYRSHVPGNRTLYPAQGISPQDEEAVSAAVPEAEITICYEEGIQKVLLNGEDVSEKIRREEVGKAASAVSAYPAVRAHLLGLQRSLAQTTNVIMDGRDIGTCVLPGAQAKVFSRPAPGSVPCAAIKN